VVCEVRKKEVVTCGTIAKWRGSMLCDLLNSPIVKDPGVVGLQAAERETVAKF
jgi:hypothetical protein